MSHLRPEELIDLLENAVAADPIERDVLTAHLASCAECRRELEDARHVMAAVSQDEVEEPSPLFWDRFSASVRDAVAAEPPSVVRDGWRSRLGLDAWTAGAVAAAAAVVLLAVAVSLRPGTSHDRLSRQQTALDRSGGRDVPLADVDEASLGLLGGLASGLSWDAASEAGLATGHEAVDAMMMDLAPDERLELQRVLQEELSRGSGRVKS
jgi:hypothetical protein